MNSEPISVLYVEDNPNDAELARHELTRAGSHINMDIVGSQAEALRMLGGVDINHYDVVLIDRDLPDGDGLSLLTHIRGRSIQVATVILTGNGDEELVVAALKAGADDYIIKGGDYLERLIPTIEAVYQQHRNFSLRETHPLRVLYAEDNPVDIDLTCRHFQAHAPFISLQVVNTASEVLEVFEKPGWQGRIDLLLVDYRLPGTNALELAKELRQVRKIDIPIVLVTGQGAEDIALQSVRLGISDYLPKSLDYLNRLPLILEDAYHRHQLAREQAALSESEKRYRSLFIDSPIAMIEEDFSEALEYIQHLRATGVSDFDQYFQENHEEIYHLYSLVKVRELNRAARKLYKIAEGVETPGHLTPIVSFTDWQPLHRELSLIAKGVSSFTLETTNQTLEGREISTNLYWLALSGYEKTLERVIVAIEDVTERKNAIKKIQQQLHQLNALRAIDEAISSNMDLRVTLRVVLDQMLKLLNVDAAAILLYHPGLRTLEYVAQQGFRENFSKSIRLQMGSGYAGIAAQRFNNISIFDLETDNGHFPKELAGIQENLRDEGFRTCMAIPLLAKGELEGALEVYLRSGPIQNPDWNHFLELLAGQAAIAVDNARLFEDLQRSNTDLIRAYDATIEGWSRALDLRDKETEGHTQRVTELTVRLCKAAGMSAEELVHIRRGALLHDIGKMGVPDAILYKPGPLDDNEWVIMRKHPEYAYDMLAPITYLRPAIDIPYCHHEQWDGSGYPRKLKGEQIPLAARIFAIVDVWDALLSDRPYRPAWELKRVQEYILQERGKHFDPEVVDLFTREMDFL